MLFRDGALSEVDAWLNVYLSSATTWDKAEIRTTPNGIMSDAQLGEDVDFVGIVSKEVEKRKSGIKQSCKCVLLFPHGTTAALFLPRLSGHTHANAAMGCGALTTRPFVFLAVYTSPPVDSAMSSAWHTGAGSVHCAQFCSCTHGVPRLLCAFDTLFRALYVL